MSSSLRVKTRACGSCRHGPLCSAQSSEWCTSDSRFANSRMLCVSTFVSITRAQSTPTWFLSESTRARPIMVRSNWPSARLSMLVSLSSSLTSDLVTTSMQLGQLITTVSRMVACSDTSFSRISDSSRLRPSSRMSLESLSVKTSSPPLRTMEEMMSMENFATASSSYVVYNNSAVRKDFPSGNAIIFASQLVMVKSHASQFNRVKKPCSELARRSVFFSEFTIKPDITLSSVSGCGRIESSMPTRMALILVYVRMTSSPAP
mmetsp:Transcript_15084/g.32417  ORF Transcript_15084/g.32417 Transcript_15084/m.32417 type:complete len:262 (-) Transcript_15084:1320-2105(-)